MYSGSQKCTHDLLKVQVSEIYKNETIVKHLKSFQPLTYDTFPQKSKWKNKLFYRGKY